MFSQVKQYIKQNVDITEYAVVSINESKKNISMTSKNK